MARWPTEDVEAILREKNARRASVPKNGVHDAFVTRGQPVQYRDGGHEVEIHYSTDVEINGRWQSLLELITANIADFRWRQAHASRRTRSRR